MTAQWDVPPKSPFAFRTELEQWETKEKQRQNLNSANEAGSITAAKNDTVPPKAQQSPPCADVGPHILWQNHFF